MPAATKRMLLLSLEGGRDGKWAFEFISVLNFFAGRAFIKTVRFLK
jgi:hypothetical protein